MKGIFSQMNKNMKYTAILPVRGGSRRLPGKNTLPFGDSNLLVHKIRQLKKVPQLDEIVVTSDSDTMLDMASAEGVRTHKRSVEYADEKTKSWGEIVAHCAQEACHGEHVMWAFCTCPLCTEENYIKAIELYEEKVLGGTEYDSLCSVLSFKHYLWDEKKALNYTPGVKHVPSQMLPDWRILVNGFMLASRANMIRWKCHTGRAPYHLFISKREAIDIDDAEDLQIAQLLYSLTEEKGSSHQTS